jgi:hypothetical protein
VCFGYERGWDAHRRNEEATAEIRRLFARYRAEAERARRIAGDYERRPASPVFRRDRDHDREPVLH